MPVPTATVKTFIFAVASTMSLAQSVSMNIIKNAARKAKLTGNRETKSGSAPAGHKAHLRSDVTRARSTTPAEEIPTPEASGPSSSARAKSLLIACRTVARTCLPPLFFTLVGTFVYGLNVWSVGAVKSNLQAILCRQYQQHKHVLEKQT